MQRKRYIICYISLLLVSAFLFVLGISSGSSGMGISEIIGVISGDASDMTRNIIIGIRLPRTLAAMLLGGALSVSGLLLQTYFGNPIAGPYVLGISSGAKLMTALMMIFAMGHGLYPGSWGMTGAAFAGSLLSMGVILALSGKVRNMAQLIIAGVMIGYICSAVTDIAVTFADDANIVNLHNWSMGSFSGTAPKDIPVIAVIALAGLVCTFLLSKPMSAYRLGEGHAASVGVDVRAFRTALILLSSLLSALVTAFAGPVSFVGVAVPHITKTIFRTSEPIVLIPAVFIGGGAFCMGCDLIARMLFSPLEMSVSTVTAVFGAPIVIAVMMKRGAK